MNERFKTLWFEAAEDKGGDSWAEQTAFMEKFAQLVVQDCANWIRENYDDSAAESLAWYLEIHYGLHGDYA